jgi:ribose 5-phosphate isomerase RpiB
MKNFKKFAVALVAVVLVIIIGVFFKAYWQKVVANVVIWICGLFGIGTPGWATKFAGYSSVAVTDTNKASSYQ